MHSKILRMIALTILAQIVVLGSTSLARAEDAKESYPTMAPIDQYLMERSAEIALARSAAPESISRKAEVMVLGQSGYETAEKGTNGFLCIVERSWADPTDDPEFWNPKARSPNCFNAAAARSFVPIFLMKTRLVLQGKTKAEILTATSAALDKKELPALEPGSMCYMMSKEQYLNDRGKSWRPHVMVFASGDAAKSWGADQDNSPIMFANDPEERVTIFMMVVGNWSDGSPAPAMGH